MFRTIELTTIDGRLVPLTGAAKHANVHFTALTFQTINGRLVFLLSELMGFFLYLLTI